MFQKVLSNKKPLKISGFSVCTLDIEIIELFRGF